MRASINGHTAIVQLLLEAGADKEAKVACFLGVSNARRSYCSNFLYAHVFVLKS